MSTSTSGPDRPLAVVRSGSALVLTICRPHAGNSIDSNTAKALRTALRAHEKDSTLRAVIITGAGGKFFCTGGDLKAYRALVTKRQLETVFGGIRRLLDAFESFPRPIIAAIDGYALGGGMEMALACDLRFAAAQAKIGFPQSQLGLIPGWNGVERLVELAGRGTALKVLSTGVPMSAALAYTLGLVDEVATEGTAVDLALEFAASLERVAPLALAAVKKVVIATLRQPGPKSRRVARDEFERLWFTQDHRAAEEAFIEKRAPKFVGR